MYNRMTRRRLLGLGATAISTTVAGCTTSLFDDWATESVSRTVEVHTGTSAYVSTNGTLTVGPASGDVVRVTGTKRTQADEGALDEVSVETNGTFGSLDVGVHIPDEIRATVDLDVRLPAKVSLSGARSENGDVTVTDITPTQEMDQPPAVTSLNGDLTARSVDGTLALFTYNGDVTAEQVSRVIDAHTGNGEVDIELHTTDWTAASSRNGNVVGRIDPELDIDVNARATNGHISVYGLDFSHVTDEPGRFTGTLGEGGPRHGYSTTNGDIELRAIG